MDFSSSSRLVPIQILLVEDNPGDVRLTLEAFKDAKLLIETHVVPDGVEAIDFLTKRGKYAAKPRPDMILLDLNLPRMNGLDVLSEIKADLDLKTIPVVVLTTSTSKQDIEQSYRLHANCYVPKPLDTSEFIGFIQTLTEFWFSLVKIPKAEPR